MLSGYSRVVMMLAWLTGLPGAVKNQPDTWYLAVGAGGQRMLSRDGKSWDKHVSWGPAGHDQNDLNVVVHFKGAFFAGGGFSRGRLTATRDGIQWSDGEIPGSSAIFGLEAVGDTLYAFDLRGRIFQSADGEVWKLLVHAELPSKNHGVRCTAQGNGLIVASGDYGAAIAFDPMTGKVAVTQMDGQKDKNSRAKRVAFGNGIFVVSGQNGLLAVSKNGKSWKNNMEDPARGDIVCVTFTGNDFLATTAKGVLRSVDGLTWTFKPAKSGTAPSHIEYVNGWLFGYGFPRSKIWRSMDGARWESLANEKGYEGIAFAYGSLAGGPPPKLPKPIFKNENR